MPNRTVFIFADDDDDREIHIDGLIPSLPEGSPIELDDASYTLDGITLEVDSATGCVVMYVTLK